VDGETLRLLGLIAPKVSEDAGCDAERRAGERAARRLRRIVAEGGLDLQRAPCTCAPWA
jgi:hypothetical protein